jgi:hypothetical protein
MTKYPFLTPGGESYEHIEERRARVARKNGISADFKVRLLVIGLLLMAVALAAATWLMLKGA